MGQFSSKVAHILRTSKLSNFRSMGSIFWDNDRFSKLPYLAVKRGHWPKFQKWHIYALSNPGARNWAYSHSTGSGFPRYSPVFKIFTFGHEFQKFHKYSLSIPRGWNWTYFCSTGSGFRDTGQFSNMPYLGMKLGKWPKFQKLSIYSLYYPRDPNFTPFCSTAGHFQDSGYFPFSQC